VRDVDDVNGREGEKNEEHVPISELGGEASQVEGLLLISSVIYMYS
jgi:hypothetical protein